MKKCLLVVLLASVVACDDSNDKPAGCGPNEAQLVSVDHGDQTITQYEYDSDGNIIHVAFQSLTDEKEYWNETITWSNGILESYEREVFVYDGSGALINSYIAERSTYGYTDDHVKENNITMVMSELKNGPQSITEYDQVDITYSANGKPETFTGKDGKTITWQYASSTSMDVESAWLKDTQAPFLSREYSEYLHFVPIGLQYVKMYTALGKYSPISEHAPAREYNRTSSGEVSYTSTYTYQTDAQGKLTSSQVEVSSCSGCNKPKTITYECK